jgi:hypothetical protein
MQFGNRKSDESSSPFVTPTDIEVFDERPSRPTACTQSFGLLVSDKVVIIVSPLSQLTDVKAIEGCDPDLLSALSSIRARTSSAEMRPPLRH